MQLPSGQARVQSSLNRIPESTDAKITLQHVLQHFTTAGYAIAWASAISWQAQGPRRITTRISLEHPKPFSQASDGKPGFFFSLQKPDILATLSAYPSPSPILHAQWLFGGLPLKPINALRGLKLVWSHKCFSAAVQIFFLSRWWKWLGAGWAASSRLSLQQPEHTHKNPSLEALLL